MDINPKNDRMHQKMNKRDLKSLKKQLLQQLLDMSGSSDCSLKGLGDADESIADLLDRASHMAERNFSHHLCSREKLLIRRIEQSLRDMDDGVYGFCERCEEEISIKRLKARPIARHCINCKTELEKMERLTGIEAS